MMFRINDLMVTSLPRVGEGSRHRALVSNCTGTAALENCCGVAMNGGIGAEATATLRTQLRATLASK
jgi:hypothetical protein